MVRELQEVIVVPATSQQLIWLFVLAAPVACIAWTVTHEALFAKVFLPVDL